MADINGKKKEPLYRRIAAKLEGEILQGTRPVGSKLPTEDELCEEWQVSSITIRRSLLELVRKGLIKKRQGEGSFVASNMPTQGRGSEKLLGFVVPDSGGYFNGTLLQIVETAVRQMGYSLIVKHSLNDPEEEAACVEMLLKQSVGGIIIVPVSGSGERTLMTCSRLISDKVPFVLLDRYLPVLNCNYVTTDHEQGGYEAAKHLIDQEHRRIAYIHTGPESASNARRRGYQRALEEAGLELDPRLQVRVGYNKDSAIEGVRKLFEQSGGDFTALFANNDDIAKFAYLELRNRGLRIPQDIAVIGYDDAPFSEFLHPALTTVRQQAEEMSLGAVDLLIQAMQGRNGGEFKQLVFGQELIVRKSTSGPPSVRQVQQAGAKAEILDVPATGKRQPQVAESDSD